MKILNFQTLKLICDVTYTADTLYLLNELNPDIEYYFILGGDSIMSF